jgi:hypothetical protein
MDFRTNSFKLDIPKGWNDQSLYMFSSKPAGQPGLSFVVTREPLLSGKSLDTYKEVILARLPAELGEIKVIAEQTSNLHSSLDILHLEMKWNSKQYGILHNHVAAFILPELNLNGEQVKQGYVFTLNSLESLYKDEYKHLFLNIVSSIKY